MRNVSLLIMLAALVVIVGFVLALVSQIAGLALIGAGCFLGIVARLVQANVQHDMVMEGFAQLMQRADTNRDR